MNLTFNKNEDHNKLLVSTLRQNLTQIKLGGGEKRIAKHHEKGKMTARERIDYLVDDPKKTIEIAAFAGDDMYKEHGGCPSGGVVVKIGYVSDKQCIIVANDATVKAGAWFPITAKKNLRAQEKIGRASCRERVQMEVCAASVQRPGPDQCGVGHSGLV